MGFYFWYVYGQASVGGGNTQVMRDAGTYLVLHYMCKIRDKFTVLFAGCFCSGGFYKGHSAGYNIRDITAVNTTMATTMVPPTMVATDTIWKDCLAFPTASPTTTLTTPRMAFRSATCA